MTLSEKETFGFSETVRKLLEQEREALEAAGWDVDAILTGLKELHDGTVAANETQEAAKRQSKAATETVVAMERQLYVTCSGYLDMAIAAVGKDTSAAKNMRRYRSSIRRPQPDAPKVQPVQPPPS